MDKKTYERRLIGNFRKKWKKKHKLNKTIYFGHIVHYQVINYYILFYTLKNGLASFLNFVGYQVTLSQTVEKLRIPMMAKSPHGTQIFTKWSKKKIYLKHTHKRNYMIPLNYRGTLVKRIMVVFIRS